MSLSGPDPTTVWPPRSPLRQELCLYRYKTQSSNAPASSIRLWLLKGDCSAFVSFIM